MVNRNNLSKKCTRKIFYDKLITLMNDLVNLSFDLKNLLTTTTIEFYTNMLENELWTNEKIRNWSNECVKYDVLLERRFTHNSRTLFLINDGKMDAFRIIWQKWVFNSLCDMSIGCYNRRWAASTKMSSYFPRELFESMA
jgi:hypothetical protein